MISYFDEAGHDHNKPPRIYHHRTDLALALCSGQAAAAVVAVVSAKNPVTSLSKNYVADIFLGKTSKFPDGSRAVPVDQAEGSAARDAFYLQFTGKSPAQVKMYWSKMIFTGRGQPPHEAPTASK